MSTIFNLDDSCLNNAVEIGDIFFAQEDIFSYFYFIISINITNNSAVVLCNIFRDAIKIHSTIINDATTSFEGYFTAKDGFQNFIIRKNPIKEITP